MIVDKEIDVVGKACPIPLITVAKEVRVMQRGQRLRIIGNDPIFEATIIDFCREGGHRIEETSRDGKKVSVTFVV
jgi:TusA-related sulfurtransferase